MAWEKAPDVLIEPLYAGLPNNPGLERRKMLGYPSAYVNGNMFIGFYENNVVVGMSEKIRTEPAGIANVWEAVLGRKMREYRRVPGDFKADPASPGSWTVDGLTYPTTQPKPRKMKKAS